MRPFKKDRNFPCGYGTWIIVYTTSMSCNLDFMKMTINPHDYETISKYLNYNPDTGVITWKIKRSNRKKAGDIAGVIDANGYRRIRIRPKLYLAHRIAWLLYYKEWPKNLVDHINMDVTDNRICNLREATQSQNMRNCRKYSTNTSGVKGVVYCKREKKWNCYITINQKRFQKGYFKTKEEAESFIKKWRNEIHGEYARQY